MTKRNLLKPYMIFFTLQLLANALLLALYTVQAFGVEHASCNSISTGVDIAERYTLAFQVGFYLHSVVFLNQTYVGPYCKLRRAASCVRAGRGYGSIGVGGRSSSESQSRSSQSAKMQPASIVESVSFCLDWVSHMAVCFLSALTLMIVYPAATSASKLEQLEHMRCTDRAASGQLADERHWLRMLAIA